MGLASVSLPEIEDSLASLANILSNDTADAAPINGSQHLVLTHWKCAITWKRTNIKQNKVHRRRRVLPDSPGRKSNCINPDAATISYNKGSKNQQERPPWGDEHRQCRWGAVHSSPAGCAACSAATVGIGYESTVYVIFPRLPALSFSNFFGSQASVLFQSLCR